MTHFNDKGAIECYKAYRLKPQLLKQKQKDQSKINNARFKRRILTYRKSKPNPKHGGWFVSHSGSPENVGLTFDSPIDVETFLELELQDWDCVFFEAGQIYNLGEFDFAANNVRFGRYGTGADPIWRGSTDISGLTWTDEGGGVYSAPMAVEPLWIGINGVAAKLAETARIPVLSRGSTTTVTISDALVSGYTTIVGSYYVMKETNFKSSQRVTVTAYNPGTGVMTISQGIPVNAVGPGNVDGVLYNKIEYLTGNNEWAWESGVLYVKAAASPSTLAIREWTEAYGMKGTSGTFTVTDIEFQEYYTSAIWAHGGRPRISGCAFHDIRDTAIIIQTGIGRVHVIGNTFDRIGNCGILCRPMTNSIFSHNTANSIGMDANYGWQTYTSGDGSIVIGGNQTNGAFITQNIDLDNDTIVGGGNNLYEYNVIDSTAYVGIIYAVGSSPTIRYNTISNFLERFEDGGAIHTFHYRKYNVPLTGVQIYNNVITGDENVLLSAGIYIDNRTIQSNVHHNTIHGCKNGIYLNFDTFGHTIEDNNIFDCHDYGIAIISGVTGVNYDNNNQNNVNRNVIACLASTQKAMKFAIQSGSFPTWNPYSGGGGANNNYYIRAAGPSAQNVFDSIAGSNRTLAQIQTEWGQDAASIWRGYNPFIVVNNTDAVSNEDADSYYKDLDGTPLENYTIAARYSRIIAENDYSNVLVSASSQNYNGGTAADIQVAHNVAFSIGFWFKVASNPGGTVSFIDNRNPSNQGFAVQMTSDGFMVAQWINTTTTNRLNLIDDVDVANNAWHHFLVTKPAATFANSKMFIDGVNAAATISDNLTASPASTSDLLIGKNPNTLLFTDCLINDIAIWNADVSADIAKIYGSATPGAGRVINLMEALTVQPIHYWRMGLTNSLLDVGTSATPLNLTGVNSPASSTDVP